MKKYLLWITASLIAGLAVWYFLKPSVYDIRVPEKPAVAKLLNREYLKPGKETRYTLPAGNWDSFSVTEGLQIIRQDLPARNLTLLMKPGALPLQMLSIWKEGTAYRQVFQSSSGLPTDSVPGLSPYHGALRFYSPVDSTKYTGVFKENHEEQSIMLRLEKPRPARIIALWNNYAISGYTDGEGIKIRIPRSAAGQNQSLIRVWVCDSTDCGQLCEIPLQNGHVALRSTGDDDHARMLLKNLKELIRHTSDIPYSPAWETRFNQWTSLLMNNSELVPVLLYGDQRGYRVNEQCHALLCSYFGKKVVFLFNDGKKLVRVSIPMKGELKQAMGGSHFNLAKNRLEVSLMPETMEILY